MTWSLAFQALHLYGTTCGLSENVVTQEEGYVVFGKAHALEVSAV